MPSNEPRITAQVLKVLGTIVSNSDGEISGAEIARSTKLASGTLYPLLLRLERAGWIVSRWEAEAPRDLGRPRRRFYKLTGIGLRKAQKAIREVVLPFKEFAWQ